MSTLATTERVSNAWRAHRDGNNKEAIRQFDEVIRVSPENVDAHYGMGLALKADGDASQAADAFRAALGYADAALTAVRTASSVEGHHGGNDLDTNDDDRYMMLSRMIRQRLDDVGAADA